MYLRASLIATRCCARVSALTGAGTLGYQRLGTLETLGWPVVGGSSERSGRDRAFRRRPDRHRLGKAVNECGTAMNDDLLHGRAPRAGGSII